MSISLNGQTLNIEQLRRIARDREPVCLSSESKERIMRCREFIEKKIASGEKIYGTNTGVGEFSEVVLEDEKLNEFQKKMIFSHCAGIGKDMPLEWVRGAMAARANVHARGLSGCRVDITETLIEMLNRGVTPRVHLKGSVGACGDLAPMAEIALLLIGEGKAFYKGKLMDGKTAMQLAEIPLPGLKVRDGLATINGSNFITAISALQICDMMKLIKAAEIACAMAMEALNANLLCIDNRIHEVRGFSGSIKSARYIRECLRGGDLEAGSVKSRLQDAYSVRSAPQVIGAMRDALDFAKQQVDIELNGVGDNPIFHWEEETILTGANFQGCPVSLPMEMMGTALTSICILSERRLNRMFDKALNSGLPMFLIKDNGMNSGMMISQYTVDSLIAEQRVLATPAYIGSIPGAGSQEDYVSMGMTTVTKNQQIIENAYGVIGIELMAAAQALDLRNRTFGKGVESAHKTIRSHVEYIDQDRVLVEDHNKMMELVHSGQIVDAVEKAIGLADGKEF